jgi:hypothetical protein
MMAGQALFTIEPDPAHVELVARLFRDFPRQAPRACMRAVNDAARYGNKIVRQALKRHVAMKIRDIGRHIRLERATLQHLAATMTISNRRIPVYQLSGRPRDPAAAPVPRRGASWKTYAEFGGRMYAQPPRRAFTARMPSGHVGIFRRIGARSLPIHELKGPSLARVARRSAPLRRELRVDVLPKFLQRLQSQLDLLLAKQAQR